MNDLTVSNEPKREFDPHPEGTFMAICRDVFVKEEPNAYYGKANEEGKVDTREMVKRIYFEFLTDEPIELNGSMYPRYVRHRLNLAWGEKSKLRPFVTAWAPDLGKQEKADLEALRGRGAYLTIQHNTGKDGRIWANVVGIAAPPKGASIPMIPPEFVRHKDRPAETAQVAEAANDPLPPLDPDALSF